MSASVSVGEVLERAADLIEPEGRWIQGHNARGKSGKPVSATGRAATCWCALGAIANAAGDWNRVNVFEAERALGLRISITLWNDAPERTQSEVVARLREAAALAREQSK